MVRMGPARLQTMRIIWGAILWSTFLYLFVVFFLRQNGTPPAEGGSPLMAPLFAALSVGLAAASIALPRVLQRTQLRAKQWRVTELPPGERLFSDRRGRSRHFEDPERVRAESLPVLQSTFIIGMALAEAIALFGFVLLLLGFSWTWGMPFFAVCWVLMLGRFPSQAKLDEQVEAAYDADLRRPAEEAPR